MDEANYKGFPLDKVKPEDQELFLEHVAALTAFIDEHEVLGALAMVATMQTFVLGSVAGLGARNSIH